MFISNLPVALSFFIYLHNLIIIQADKKFICFKTNIQSVIKHILVNLVFVYLKYLYFLYTKLQIKNRRFFTQN